MEHRLDGARSIEGVPLHRNPHGPPLRPGVSMVPAASSDSFLTACFCLLTSSNQLAHQTLYCVSVKKAESLHMPQACGELS